MPLYEYECKDCGARFERVQPVTAPTVSECVECGGGPARRVLHPAGLIFKGSGWYITDSRKPASTAAAPTGAKSDSDTPSPAPAPEKASSDSGTKVDSE